MKIPGKKQQTPGADEASSDDELESVDITSADLKADKTDFTEVRGKREDTTSSFTDKIKTKFAKDSSKEKESSGKKSFISKPIAIILGLGIVLFLFGEEWFSNKEPAVDPEVQVQAKMPKKPKKVVEENKEVPVEVEATEAVPEEVSNPPVEVSTEAEPTIEELPIESIPPVEVTVSPEEPTMTEEPTFDTPPVESSSDTTDIEPTSFDTVDDTTVTTPSDNMTDKILEDLEKQVKDSAPKPQVTTYKSPPDYEFKGRGLVYNCVGKHWACIDGPSYKTCEENASSTQYLKKSKECYPFNVYQTQGGCEKTQYRMVSSGAKTKFCNEN